MAPWSAFVLALAVVGLLSFVLRWTFGNDRTAVPTGRDSDGYGLLREVAIVPTEAAAQVLRTRLRAAGIRATTARGDNGAHRVLVFPADEANARLLLSGSV
ncbi:hypothetical protein F0L68_21095 [Solihabitans fulvus]|uniref:Uncharacterized protein n=1 Tax=Solihabitans fulvus TaxID=1892852 RepID=A0A5B2X7F4_9PSEU|nr:hypothetical protein [Solihabitans fulvus]KAA2259438.1 hypothetical protein F0L68_21095 [Solihabitans fulvus]